MPGTRSFFIAIGIISGLTAFAQDARAQMPCANDIMPLRGAVEKDSLLVKAAIEKKDRGEICSALKKFTAAEAKFVKFMEDNQSWCGVPPDVVQQLKKNQSHAVKLRGQACAAGPAAGRPAVPAGPGLSEALGTSRGPVGSTAKTGTGTFDTLTGPSMSR